MSVRFVEILDLNNCVKMIEAPLLRIDSFLIRKMMEQFGVSADEVVNREDVVWGGEGI